MDKVHHENYQSQSSPAPQGGTGGFSGWLIYGQLRRLVLRSTQSDIPHMSSNRHHISKIFQAICRLLPAFCHFLMAYCVLFLFHVRDQHRSTRSFGICPASNPTIELKDTKGGFPSQFGWTHWNIHVGPQTGILRLPRFTRWRLSVLGIISGLILNGSHVRWMILIYHDLPKSKHVQSMF